MKMLLPITTVACGACVGLAAGLALRHFGPSPTAGPKTGQASDSKRPSALTEPGRRRNSAAQNEASLLTAQLAHNLSKATGVTRWLYWWDAIEKAGPADFPRLARLAGRDRAVIRLLAERWATLSPQTFFDALRNAATEGKALPDSMADVLFNHWLKTDQAAAVASLSGSEDFPQRNQWRQQVAMTLIDTDPEAGLKAIGQWHIENFIPNLRKIRNWAAADPRHAAEFTLANGSGAISRAVIEEIGKVWADSAPEAALNFAISQPGEPSSRLAQTVLKHWAAKDLNQAAQWLANSDSGTLNKFSPAFVEAWAGQDPSAALAWCQQNLTGSSLTEAMRGLFQGAAQKDAAAAAELVAAMPPSSARTQAAAAVADKWFPNTVEPKSVPAETIAWLATLDPDSIGRAVDSIAWRWAEADPDSLANFLRSMTNVAFQTYAYDNLARSMARNDPSAALNWTASLPEGLAVSVGSVAFSQWGQTQPEAAMQWLNQLASNDTRRQPFFTSLVQQLAWDPQNYDRLAQIALTDPARTRAIIQNMGLSEDRRSTLLAKLSPATNP